MSELLPCPFCGADAEIEHSYHEDDNRYPRDFWHCRVRCTVCSMADTGWSSYGEQEQRNVPPEVTAAAEANEIAAWNRRAPPVETETLMEHLRNQRAWVKHWQEDVAAGLKPSTGSLAKALENLDAALSGSKE